MDVADNDADMTLLDLWRRGDRKAGNDLIRRHYSYAFGIARKRLGDDDAAAEATQHAMTVVVRKRDIIEDNFRAYLAKVVVFSVLSQNTRRQKQQRHDPIDDNEPAAKLSPGPSTTMELRGEVKLLVRALRSLEIDDQLIFYYDIVGEKTRMELAELLGLEDKKRIFKRVHRAKQRLKKEIQQSRDAELRQSTLGGLDTWLASVYRKAPKDPDKE